MFESDDKRDEGQQRGENQVRSAERQAGLWDQCLRDEERHDDAADGLGAGEDAPQRDAVLLAPPLGEDLGGGDPCDALDVPGDGPEEVLEGEAPHVELEGEVEEDGGAEAGEQQRLRVDVVGEHAAGHLANGVREREEGGERADERQAQRRVHPEDARHGGGDGHAQHVDGGQRSVDHAECGEVGRGGGVLGRRRGGALGAVLGVAGGVGWGSGGSHGVFDGRVIMHREVGGD